MSRTFTSLLTHVIFSTKERFPFITPGLRTNLCPYLGGIVRNLGGKPILINAVADHVHLLVELPAKIAVSDALRSIKASSSLWVHETQLDSSNFASKFAWQTGYGAFSVSRSNVASVAGYIEGQEEHHRKRSFQEEFLDFLKRHEIEYDERYLWD